MRLFFNLVAIAIAGPALALMIYLGAIWNEAASVLALAEKNNFLPVHSADEITLSEQVVAFYEFEHSWGLGGFPCPTFTAHAKDMATRWRELHGATVGWVAARSVIREISLERSFRATLRDMFAACQLERRFDNLTLLRFWLGRAYFGNGEYGIDFAAASVFGKPLNELDINEAAQLAALLRSPGLRDNKSWLKKRSQVVAERIRKYRSDLEMAGSSH